MQFTIEFQADHLARAMEVVRLEIATPQQMLGSLGESLLRVNQERHDQGLAPDGTKWKEASPMTIGSELSVAAASVGAADAVAAVVVVPPQAARDSSMHSAVRMPRKPHALRSPPKARGRGLSAGKSAFAPFLSAAGTNGLSRST